MTIPDSVTEIKLDTFAGCGLTSVVIPNSIQHGEYAFAWCNRLTSVTIGNSVTGIENNAFYGCSGLTSVVIPNSVTSIENNAFYGCSGLTSVTIGNSVTYIGSYAFYNCTSLTSVVIPNSVTFITECAFSGCTGLTRAYFYGNAPYLVQGVFYGCSSNFSVCYSAGATGFTTPTWYGYPAAVCAPTAITLSTFTAKPFNSEVILKWATETELDNAGFNLYRSEAENGQYDKINASLIPAQGSPIQGASYEFTDTDVQNRKTYYYKLEDIELNGTSTMHGPVSAKPRLIYGRGNK